MHGLTGNKNEGNKLAPLVIPLGINLLTFDFTGCGNSQSKFITLGWKETDDLQAVLDWLAENHQTSRVVLWGRSLGAVTALFYEQSHSPVPIAGLILDSTFCKFKEIADAMVEKMMPGMQSEAMKEIMWPQVIFQFKEYTKFMPSPMSNKLTSVPGEHGIGMDLSNLNPIEYAS